MARLSIDLSDTEHKAIKSMAATNGVSIRDLVLSRVFDDDTGKSGHQITLEAIRELESGGGTRYKDVQAMMDDILSDEDKP
mgnify:CR=1 FL=1